MNWQMEKSPSASGRGQGEGLSICPDLRELQSPASSCVSSRRSGGCDTLFSRLLCIATLRGAKAAGPPTCAAATALEVSPENQLAAAEAKWAANKPKAYEFTFRLIACCVIPLTGPAAEPIVFRVEGGKAFARERGTRRDAQDRLPYRLRQIQHSGKPICLDPSRTCNAANYLTASRSVSRRHQRRCCKSLSQGITLTFTWPVVQQHWKPPPPSPE
jgi:hypothetical protein